jgi:hypothetical protein
MSDGLAEKLYFELVKNTPNIGIEAPPWNRLAKRDRLAWEQVAILARKHMHAQCAAELGRYRDELGSANAVDTCVERWSTK